MHSSQAWIKEEGWSYGCRYNDHKKKDERNPNHRTNHRFGKGGKMVVGTYRHFAHSMSMITTVRKHLLGNGDRWQNVRWTPMGFQPTDHDDDDIKYMHLIKKVYIYWNLEIIVFCCCCRHIVLLWRNVTII